MAASTPIPASDAPALLGEAATLAEAALERLLPGADEAPQRLHQAMRHSVFAGGKRLRPGLVLGAFRTVVGRGPAATASRQEALAAAMAAVEMLHTYTLIHDDLPAMDDDDLRRGRPTCHKAFDEGTAILAGDALQAAAFAAVAAVGVEAVAALTRAGIAVVQGQQDDLDAEGSARVGGEADRALLERIHRRKTAALIRASCELGALAAGADHGQRQALAAYGEALGLAFQVADDVLDATATSEALGKTAGKDAAQGKLTYVAIYGLDEARRQAASLEREAVAALVPFGEAAAPLVALARFVVRREH